MVHLAGIPGDWEEHVHATGRHFLGNRGTSETRWTWQKWSMDGRVFVRNICTDERMWADEMNLPMRIAAGLAEPGEVEAYANGWRGDPAPRAAAPPQNGFGVQTGYAPREAYNLHNVQKDRSMYNDHSARGDHAALQVNNLNKQQHPHNAHNGHDPHVPYVAHTVQSPQAHQVSQVPHSQHAPHQNALYSAPQLGEGKKLANTPDEAVSGAHSAGRFWAEQGSEPVALGVKPQKKKSKRSLKKERQRAAEAAALLEGLKPSRFGAVVEDEPQVRPKSKEPRPKPTGVFGGHAVSPRRRGSLFRPKSGAARGILEVAMRVRDGVEVAILHDRDFARGSTDQGPVSSIFEGGDDDEIFLEPVIGTSTILEKKYLRLTSAPKPSDVRPPPVLREALTHIKKCWRQQDVDYDWVCRQLKSMRQDFKVQHVESFDVVDVYETHSRIALENGDLGEFNTCVAQVQELYNKVDRVESVQDEFVAYRILYNLLVGADEVEQGRILAQFTAHQRQRPATRFAMAVRRAVLTGNYCAFSRLGANPPARTMVSYLMDRMLPFVRSRALATMAAAYGPGQPATLPLSFVFAQLGWAPTDNSDCEEIPQSPSPCNGDPDDAVTKQMRLLRVFSRPRWIRDAVRFVLSTNAVVVSESVGSEAGLDGLALDCKASKAAGVRVISQGGGLITHAGSAL